MRTYVERDVRQLLDVRDLGTFQRFVRMCAARTGQLLNLSGLAGDCGISHNTAWAWISVLEASYLVHQLQPHHRNFEKRLVKTPKLYFLDPGLAAWLLGIETPSSSPPTRSAAPRSRPGWCSRPASTAPCAPTSSSGATAAAARSTCSSSAARSWCRPRSRPARTAAADFFDPIDRWRAIAGEAAERGWVVYGGEERQNRGQGELVGWRGVGELVEGPNRAG